MFIVAPNQHPNSSATSLTMTLNRVPVLLLMVLLAGCANTIPIQPVSTGKSGFDDAVFSGETINLESAEPGVEQYRTFHQAATGFVSLASLRASVEKNTDDFCARKGKVVRGISETSSKPPYILGNFPRLEFVFQCVDKPPTETSSNGRDKYDELVKLKKLLDDGALTPEEFNREKAKVLSSP